MIGSQQFTDRRVHARLSAAYGFDLQLDALHLVHVGRRSADVADDALEIGIGRHVIDLPQDRILTA